MTADHERSAEISPVLTAEQVVRLDAYGKREAVAEGAILFDEGDRGIDFFVVLAGRVEICQYAAEEMRTVIRPGPGQFLGNPSTLTGRAAVVQARAMEASEVLRIAPEAFRRVAALRPDPADVPQPPHRPDRRRARRDQGRRLALLPRRPPAPRVPDPR